MPQADFFLEGLERIKPRLSNEVYGQIKSSMETGFAQDFKLLHHQDWIILLLRNYYDPLYLKDIKKQQAQVCFEGTIPEVRDYLSTLFGT